MSDITVGVAPPPAQVVLAPSGGVSVEAGQYIAVVPRDVPRYGGAYEVTPSTQTQTLATSGTLLGRDVTIGPIPSNYGLVTWTGAVLTVS